MADFAKYTKTDPASYFRVENGAKTEQRQIYRRSDYNDALDRDYSANRVAVQPRLCSINVAGPEYTGNRGIAKREKDVPMCSDYTQRAFPIKKKPEEPVLAHTVVSSKPHQETREVAAELLDSQYSARKSFRDVGYAVNPLDAVYEHRKSLYRPRARVGE